ncbi:Beta-taxilin [Frankliniella fusca]|uniref:Beta-taxilin n=1 Tax=Frankliniella fusca TaxID=407009 RepID=A0AAE1I4E9_9NEOP|nr:Beta-taxilin [Frankliniella fusca]
MCPCPSDVPPRPCRGCPALSRCVPVRQASCPVPAGAVPALSRCVPVHPAPFLCPCGRFFLAFPIMCSCSFLASLSCAHAICLPLPYISYSVSAVPSYTLICLRLFPAPQEHVRTSKGTAGDSTGCGEARGASGTRNDSTGVPAGHERTLKDGFGTGRDRLGCFRDT